MACTRYTACWRRSRGGTRSRRKSVLNSAQPARQIHYKVLLWKTPAIARRAVTALVQQKRRASCSHWPICFVPLLHIPPRLVARPQTAPVQNVLVTASPLCRSLIVNPSKTPPVSHKIWGARQAADPFGAGAVAIHMAADQVP